jgi:hypothetical protein
LASASPEENWFIANKNKAVLVRQFFNTFINTQED